VVVERTGAQVQGEPTDPFLLTMLRAGGLIPMAARLAGEEGLAGEEQATG